jgi:hypothetical protein
MGERSELFLVSPGPRPPYWKVAEELWGKGCDIDSDGNSTHPDDRLWTELTISLRTRGADSGDGLQMERVDIDPVSDDPLVLKLSASTGALAIRVAEYMARQTSARISSTWQRP